MCSGIINQCGTPRGNVTLIIASRCALVICDVFEFKREDACCIWIWATLCWAVEQNFFICSFILIIVYWWSQTNRSKCQNYPKIKAKFHFPNVRYQSFIESNKIEVIDSRILWRWLFEISWIFRSYIRNRKKYFLFWFWKKCTYSQTWQ